jgi:hypothetical protein
MTVEGAPLRLELVRRTRPGGGGRTERSFLDFEVDGSSLFDLLVARGHDCITPLGWGDRALERATLRRLRLEDPPSFAGKREPLFVCAECGDLGCGAVTARISAAKGLVEWSDLAWQTDWGEPSRAGYEDVGPFLFEFRAYRAALTLDR